MIKRFLIGAAVLAAAALLLSLNIGTSGTVLADFSTPTPGPSPTPTATPDPNVTQDVDTNALVTGVGVAPVIECKWELPDMQVGVSGSTFPDGDLQYGTATDPHQHDDDMAVVPDADNNPSNGIQIPCDGPPAIKPTMPNGVKHMIQVAPVPEDDPEERQIQLWMAVDHPNGISNITFVYWRIYHPDGTFKIQVDGTKVAKEACDPDLAASLGDSAAIGKMFEAAVHTGQVSTAAVDDPNKGLLSKCVQQEKAIYYGSFDLSKEQMCGEYRIEGTAVSTGGMTKLTNYIDVPCVFYLRIDFDEVDWGTVTPDLVDWVSGDLLWDDPADNAPTVKNVGNSGMGLGLHFSKMVGLSEEKEITEFDACFGKSFLTLECIDPIVASTPVEFCDNEDQVLCANEIGKLDLSIHPPDILPPDTYRGTLDVIGRHVKDICEGIE